MDLKVGDLKKKSRQLVQVAPEKITHFRTHEFMLPKQKILFFIPMKVQLITISSVIPYISGMNNTSSSLKKKKFSRERKREGKRERESAKEKEKEKEKKEEKEKEEKEEEEKMEKAVLKVLL